MDHTIICPHCGYKYEDDYDLDCIKKTKSFTHYTCILGCGKQFPKNHIFLKTKAKIASQRAKSLFRQFTIILPIISYIKEKVASPGARSFLRKYKKTLLFVSLFITIILSLYTRFAIFDVLAAIFILIIVVYLIIFSFAMLWKSYGLVYALGAVLTAIGIIGLIVSFFCMETTVGRVYNIGLMHERQMTMFLFSVILIAGLIFLATLYITKNKN